MPLRTKGCDPTYQRQNFSLARSDTHNQSWPGLTLTTNHGQALTLTTNHGQARIVLTAPIGVICYCTTALYTMCTISFPNGYSQRHIVIVMLVVKYFTKKNYIIKHLQEIIFYIDRTALKVKKKMIVVPINQILSRTMSVPILST